MHFRKPEMYLQCVLQMAAIAHDRATFHLCAKSKKLYHLQHLWTVSVSGSLCVHSCLSGEGGQASVITRETEKDWGWISEAEADEAGEQEECKRRRCKESTKSNSINIYMHTSSKRDGNGRRHCPCVGHFIICLCSRLSVLSVRPSLRLSVCLSLHLWHLTCSWTSENWKWIWKYVKVFWHCCWPHTSLAGCPLTPRFAEEVDSGQRAKLNIQ